MNVLIAGCGYVGSQLGLLLQRDGHRVWGLRRDPSVLPDEIELVAADLLAEDLASRLPPAHRIVYAASADGRDPDAYRRVYVDGVANLLKALQAPGRPAVERFIFVSSTAVYADTGGDWVDEESLTEPENFRGSTVLEGERLALEARFSATVLRLGGIYGPGRTRLLEMVREGRARCPANGPIWSNRIHRDDAARALYHLLEMPDPAPVYLGVDEEPTPICQVYRELARMLGAPEPEVDPELTRRRSNKRCSSRLLRASGFTFRYPTFRDGYQAMIDSAAAG